MGPQTPRDYFVDGPIGVYLKRGAGNVVDRAILYVAMRRGGRQVYALDVTTPGTPRFLWKVTPSTPGMSLLGQTWSEPRVIKVKGQDDPVVIFGGGYDATAEDSGGAVTMGHAVFALNALTGQVLRTQQGDAIVARLDEARLAEAAELAHGRYRTLTLSDRDIDHLLATPLPGADETAEVERDFDTWADMGFWACVLLLPLVLGGFRRGALALVPLLLLPAPADAGLWADLWQRRDQQGYQALRDGAPERAATLFEEDVWQAAAHYRSREFERAADGYLRQDGISARYNLGNALAQQERYADAIAAYDAVLAADPDHEDAQFNKALVEKLLSQQQSSQSGNDQRQQQGGDEPEHAADPQDGEGDARQDGSDQAPGEQPQQPPPEARQAQQPRPGEQRDEELEQETLSSRDERQDALEQWLRRVPDDPGGLLRRKFQYETNQRLRRGDYRSQETEKIW
jgi:Ca-activated chloride channel family protein